MARGASRERLEQCMQRERNVSMRRATARRSVEIWGVEYVNYNVYNTSKMVYILSGVPKNNRCWFGGGDT